MPKFNTQFSDLSSFVTECGTGKEVLYDLKYSEVGEPYLVPNGKIRDINDEIQKAKVLVVDIATLYERFVSGDIDCLNIVCGGEYLDASVWSQDMIENASRAYNEFLKSQLNGDVVVNDTNVENTESEGKSE